MFPPVRWGERGWPTGLLAATVRHDSRIIALLKGACRSPSPAPGGLALRDGGDWRLLRGGWGPLSGPAPLAGGGNSSAPVLVLFASYSPPWSSGSSGSSGTRYGQTQDPSLRKPCWWPSRGRPLCVSCAAGQLGVPVPERGPSAGGETPGSAKAPALVPPPASLPQAGHQSSVCITETGLFAFQRQVVR